MVYAGPQPAWQAFEREGEGNQDSGLVSFYNIFKNKPIMYVLRVCGDAVLLDLWCGFAEICILS